MLTAVSSSGETMIVAMETRGSGLLKLYLKAGVEPSKKEQNIGCEAAR